jgi:cytochrome P450
MSMVRPTIVARQQELLKSGQDKPKDFLQWTMDRAAASGLPIESEINTIANRILTVEFAAIHTSTISITNNLFDLVASDPENIDVLRDEIESALTSTGGVWSKQTVQKLVKLDSALRESGRLNVMGATAMTREVIAPDGLTTPDGLQCAPGSWVAVAARGIHLDPEVYTGVSEYRPFRFSDMKAVSDEEQGERTKEDMIKKANLGLVTTSPTFMSFGHGRHACPGRFFAANELKLMLAYMILNYDFVKLEERPPNTWVGEIQIPPMKATIRVKRRQHRSKL